MSDEKQQNETVSENKPEAKNDSFGFDNKKSPWLIYALLQIPILIIMIIVLYFIYQQRQGG